jgi:hypothetical protein
MVFSSCYKDNFSDLTFVVDNRDREETGTVEVDIGVEEVFIEH